VSELVGTELTIRQGLDVSEAQESFISGDKRQIKDQRRSRQKAVGGIQVERELAASESHFVGEGSQFGSGDGVRYPLGEITVQMHFSPLV